MLALKIGFLALALVGHAAFWVAVVNRWHATGFSRAVVKTVTLAFYAALIVPVAALGWHVLRDGLPSTAPWSSETGAVAAYSVLCAVYGGVHVGHWIWRRLRPLGAEDVVRPLGSRVVDMAQQLGASPARGPRARLFERFPGNQLWKMNVEEFAVIIPGLPAALEGFSISHWSDLHFCGRIDRGYFDEVVRLTNELGADVVALTGDICDSVRYIDWIPDILGATRARLGKYFILGNHDLRTRDTRRVRQAMAAVGFTDVAGRCLFVGPGSIVIAGNERPWSALEPPPYEIEQSRRADLRILLAHTPDQLGWARAKGFQLMLAGHTHGGQVRFPIIGPVLCPSWHGTKYADGFFHEPPTLLHVSRGTGSLFPLRLMCPPQITKLVLYGSGRS